MTTPSNRLATAIMDRVQRDGGMTKAALVETIEAIGLPRDPIIDELMALKLTVQELRASMSPKRPRRAPRAGVGRANASEPVGW